MEEHFTTNYNNYQQVNQSSKFGAIDKISDGAPCPIF